MAADELRQSAAGKELGQGLLAEFESLVPLSVRPEVDVGVRARPEDCITDRVGERRQEQLAQSPRVAQ